jgi:hypothetical protein
MSSVAVTRGSVTYGFLEPGDERWGFVREQYLERGVDPPDEDVVVAFAESDDARSFHCMRSVYHSAMYIHPKHRPGGRVLLNLIGAMQAAIEGVTKVGAEVYVVADRPETLRLCEAMGMTRVESPVYVRTVRKPQV